MNTPENAGRLRTFIDRGAGGTLVLESSRISDTQAAHHLARLQSTEHQPFRLVGVGSLRWSGAGGGWQLQPGYCFAMTQIACTSLFLQRPDDIQAVISAVSSRKACLRLNHQCRK